MVPASFASMQRFDISVSAPSLRNVAPAATRTAPTFLRQSSVSDTARFANRIDAPGLPVAQASFPVGTFQASAAYSSVQWRPSELPSIAKAVGVLAQ